MGKMGVQKWAPDVRKSGDMQTPPPTTEAWSSSTSNRKLEDQAGKF